MKSISKLSILLLFAATLTATPVLAANGPGAKGQKGECRKEIELACGTVKGEQRKSCVQNKQQSFSPQCRKGAEGNSEKKVARNGTRKGAGKGKHQTPTS